MERMKMNDLKILYRGDIDDAPEGTDLVKMGNKTWHKITSKPSCVSVYYNDTLQGNGWLEHQYPYQLVKALCLSAEQEERLSGVWIDGQWREIRIVADGFNCPFCDRKGGDHAESDCKAQYVFSILENRFWLAPAPAPKEPEWKVTPTLFVHISDARGDQYPFYWNPIDERYERCYNNICYPAETEIEVAKYQKPISAFVFVTRKGEQDGK